MTDIQFHRGPDAGGIREYPDAVLGHRRLSIIDLSDRGLQPMESADGRYVLVFNGEIYNYKELRQELTPKYSFSSDSDTEVLLASWYVWGEQCLERLNGMFAFCVYDTQERVAFVARDRFGQKPLFLAERDNRLHFASEVKGLLAAGIEAAPDISTWARYLRTASYDDTQNTVFAGVSQLLAGECAWFTPGKGLRRQRYYSLGERIDPRRMDLGDAADQVREIMVDACSVHMRSDVPVAIMLSGGLDSSSLLACLDLADELNQSVKCFSVEFGGELTERPWIEAAAGHHGLPSRIDGFDPQGYLDSLKPMVWHLEGPVGGLMNCGLRLVTSAARDEGYIVLQDGSGADEIFAGYRNHHNLFLAQLIRENPHDAESAIISYARNWDVDVDMALKSAEAEWERSGTAIDGTIPVRPDLFTMELSRAEMAQPPEVSSTGDRLRDSLVEYTQGSKIPRNLRMMDRLSMGYGLELRLPFLDPRLVELALSLPPEFYFLEGRTKGIMRAAMSGAMNDGVRLATKRSIQAPQGLWLRQEPMRSYVFDLIGSESFASRGLFDVEKCRTTFEEFCKGKYDNSFFVWQWINVEEWFRIFVDNDAVREVHPLCPAVGGALGRSTIIDSSHATGVTETLRK